MERIFSQYMDAQHFAAGAYIIMLIALVFFIALAAILIITLNKKLKSTLGREGKGAAFSHAVLLAHEDERARISRDLYDTIAQDLRGLSLQLGAVGEKEREELDAAAAKLRSLVDKVRVTCNHLVPPNFRFQGIKDALRHLCHDFGERTGIECRADIAEGPADDAIDEKMQVQIYRIIQEALTNVAKHAKATEVSVMYRLGADGSIRAGVFDDGAGFTRTDHPVTNKGLEGIGRFAVCAQATTLAEAKRHIEEATQLGGGGVYLPSVVILNIMLGDDNGLDFLIMGGPQQFKV